jgi:hypothetical protein
MRHITLSTRGEMQISQDAGSSSVLAGKLLGELHVVKDNVTITYSPLPRTRTGDGTGDAIMAGLAHLELREE